jgi:hypothetical protein
VKKNRLLDLNDHLFEQLERLNDDDLEGEKLGQEMKRAASMANVAKQIIDGGRLAFEAKKAVLTGMVGEEDVPGILKLEK